MFRTTAGPEREALGFEARVRSDFGFLESEHGFVCASSGPTFVRYGSSTAFVQVYHGRASFQVDVELGLRSRGGRDERPFGLGELLGLLGVREAEGFDFLQASSPEAVAQCVERLAGLVRRHAGPALDGDPALFARLAEYRQRKSDELLSQMRLKRAREAAEQAFHERRWADLVRSYEPVRQDLSPAELKKLEYARKQVSSS